MATIFVSKLMLQGQSNLCDVILVVRMTRSYLTSVRPRGSNRADKFYGHVTYVNWHSYYVQTVGFCGFESHRGYHFTFTREPQGE